MPVARSPVHARAYGRLGLTVCFACRWIAASCGQKRGAVSSADTPFLPQTRGTTTEIVAWLCASLLGPSNNIEYLREYKHGMYWPE